MAWLGRTSEEASRYTIGGSRKRRRILCKAYSVVGTKDDPAHWMGCEGGWWDGKGLSVLFIQPTLHAARDCFSFSVFIRVRGGEGRGRRETSCNEDLAMAGAEKIEDA